MSKPKALKIKATIDAGGFNCRAYRYTGLRDKCLELHGRIETAEAAESVADWLMSACQWLRSKGIKRISNTEFEALDRVWKTSELSHGEASTFNSWMSDVNVVRAMMRRLRGDA
jgi:site-specific recombinase